MTEMGQAKKAAQRLQESDLWAEIKRQIKIDFVRINGERIEVVVPTQTAVDWLNDRYENRIKALNIGSPVRAVARNRSYY